MIPGLFSIADAQGQGRPFKSLLEIYALKLKEGKVTGSRDPDRSSERALVEATALATLLDVLFEVAESVSWEAWQAWVEEGMLLLAQGNADDERWIEVRWLLRYSVAQGNYIWGNYAESADLFRTLLLELDEGRFRPWPYTDEARCCWRIRGVRWLGFDALDLGQYEEAQRLAEQSIALAEQIGSQFFRSFGLGVLASALIYLGHCREAEKHAREQLRIHRSYRNFRREAAVPLEGSTGIGRTGRLSPGTCLSAPGGGVRRGQWSSAAFPTPLGWRGVGARQSGSGKTILSGDDSYLRGMGSAIRPGCCPDRSRQGGARQGRVG